MEIKKLVPALMLSFEVSLSREDTTMDRYPGVKLYNGVHLTRLQIELIDPAMFMVEDLWMFRQKGLGVRIKRRT